MQVGRHSGLPPVLKGILCQGTNARYEYIMVGQLLGLDKSFATTKFVRVWDNVILLRSTGEGKICLRSALP